jgi:hypothetical protein
VNPRRPAKSCAWGSRSRRFPPGSPRVASLSRRVPGWPGHGRCWPSMRHSPRRCAEARAFQPEFLSREPVRYREFRRNEERITHRAMLAVWPSRPPRRPQLNRPRWLAHGHSAVRATSELAEGHGPSVKAFSANSRAVPLVLIVSSSSREKAWHITWHFRAFDLHGVPTALRLSGKTDVVRAKALDLSAARLWGLDPHFTCRAGRRHLGALPSPSRDLADAGGLPLPWVPEARSPRGRSCAGCSVDGRRRAVAGSTSGPRARNYVTGLGNQLIDGTR